MWKVPAYASFNTHTDTHTHTHTHTRTTHIHTHTHAHIHTHTHTQTDTTQNSNHDAKTNFLLNYIRITLLFQLFSWLYCKSQAQNTSHLLYEYAVKFHYYSFCKESFHLVQWRIQRGAQQACTPSKFWLTFFFSSSFVPMLHNRPQIAWET